MTTTDNSPIPLTLTESGHPVATWQYRQVEAAFPLDVAELDALGSQGWCLAAVSGSTWIFRGRPVVVATMDGVAQPKKA
jgi:hypothetical protein